MYRKILAIRCSVFFVVLEDVHLDLEAVRVSGVRLREFFDNAWHGQPDFVISSTEETSEMALVSFQDGLNYTFCEEQVFQDRWFNKMKVLSFDYLYQKFFLRNLFKKWVAFVQQQQGSRILFFCHRTIMLNIVQEFRAIINPWVRYVQEQHGSLDWVGERLESGPSGEVIRIDFDFFPSVDDLIITSIIFFTDTTVQG